MEQRRISVAKLKSNSGQIDGVPANPREWTKEDVSMLAKSIEQTPELLEAIGKWDFDALGNEWDDLPLSYFGVDIPKEWSIEPTGKDKGETFNARLRFADEDSLTKFLIKYQQTLEREFGCDIKV